MIFGKLFPGLRKGRASQTTNQHSGLRSFYRHTYISQALDAFHFFKNTDEYFSFKPSLYITLMMGCSMSLFSVAPYLHDEEQSILD